MRRAITSLTILILSAASALPMSAQANASPDDDTSKKTYRFAVYLEEDPIGSHSFVIEERGDTKVVESNASLNVKLLFFNAYEYEHQNREVWHQDCLREMRSRTNDNGELFSVTATSGTGKLSVETLRNSNQLRGCVRSFAYWDPDLIVSERLLNAQTGEHLDVNVQRQDPGSVDYQGTTVQANRYRINSKKLKIDVWYTPQGEWIALDSVKDGKLIRYRLK